MSQHEAEESSSTSLAEACCDTCILLNFVQQEWERDRTSDLLEGTDVRFVISEAVEEEFENKTDIRADAYNDLLTAVLSDEDELSDFTPDVWGNDEQHLYELIGHLETLDPEVAATKFRQYQRKFRSRTEYVLAELIHEVVFTAPPLFFASTLHDVVSNENDCQVLAQVADWAHNGGSGVFVTMDRKDILEKESSINECIDDEYDDGTMLVILAPEAALKRAQGEMAG